MTNEELLEKAKRDYPEGTEFISAYSGRQVKSTSTPYLFRDGNIYAEYKYNDSRMGQASIYESDENKWAEIVSKPEYTIQDLADGKVACINDGTLEELNLVLKAAFPECLDKATGSTRYYFKGNGRDWLAWGTMPNRLELPTQSVKVFIKQLEQNRGLNHDKTFINEAVRNFNDTLRNAIILANNKPTFEKGGIEENKSLFHANEWVQERSNKISNKLINMVKEDLKEKKTQVLYLNEEDRPTVEERLSFVDWYYKNISLSHDVDWDDLDNKQINQYINMYHDYLNNLPEQNPIEFEQVYSPSQEKWIRCGVSTNDFNLIIVISKQEFIGIKLQNDFGQCRYKGKLNSGTV